MAFDDPVRILAPTMVRYSMVRTLPNNRASAAIVDVSLDVLPTATREDALASTGPWLVGKYQDLIVGPSWQYGTFVGAHWIDLDSLTGQTGFVGPQSGKPVTGTATASMCSPNCSYLIHKNSTSRRGQRQGRLYAVGVAENDVDSNGTLTTAVRNSETAKWEGFRNAIGTVTSLTGVESLAWRTIHVHKPNKDDPATWTWTSSTIDTVSCDNIIATQRKRMR
jgi:hypothetical protein